MKPLDDYNKALQEIYNHVGFVEDYVVYPIDDRREFLWFTVTSGQPYVRYARKKTDLETGEGDCYEDEIYHQRFYPKAIYEGKEYTMILVDTHTDGNKFFAIYDNKKKIEST